MNNDTFTQQIANTIYQHRKIAALTQVELAELADVGKTAIFDIEHGKKSIRLDTLLKILKVLNIKLKFESKYNVQAQRENT